MLAAKIYGLIWILTALTAVGVYLTGFFNETTLTIFGFVFSTLLFLGVVAVAPALMNDHYDVKRLSRAF